MTSAEFLAALEEALAADAGTFAPGRSLADIKQWDSLGVVEFQSLVDEKLGLDLAPQRITACETVDDLLALVAAKVQG